MHNLRRTFGYNLIRQDRSIYEVSKVLRRLSVNITEHHYAPLLETDIKSHTDFFPCVDVFINLNTE